MSVFDRPYAGSWSPNKKTVVRYTPDCILFLNGDTNIPGHKPEKQVIDIQRFVTQVSVDSGTDSGSCSASFTLSIPKDIGSSLFSDGHSVFQPGLEVHIYMRGYFPVEGLGGKTLGEEELKALQDVLGDQASNLALRPYYHCFHGVTTTANLEYSGGFYSINQSCTGMLHFWQYHDISTNASLFGTRPTGSKLKMSLVGHNFTNMSPFSIVYSLYKDTAGAAGGVAFALSASSNQSKKFFSENRSLFEMSALYWQKRFETKMYNLRMFGVNGEQLNSAQTAMIGRMSTSQLRASAEINLRHHNNARTEATDPTRANSTSVLAADATGATTALTGTEYTNKGFSNAMLQYLERAGEKSGYAVSAAQLKAFVNDIGQWGNVNLFESSYTSKLDIATAAATAVGYEFYQDVDGDLVFKPPLYNMDTSGMDAYRIEPSEIVSITRASAEPQCTYMTVKSGQFSNFKGLGLEGEWGVRGQYIDYRLVGKYGWRPGDFDAQFYSDARGAFWAAVARMDVINEAMETANIVIPLRPELRPGFPVYVRHLDCFYYVKSMSHSFSYGGQCTTTLQCVAQRKKFLPPGLEVAKLDTDGDGVVGSSEWGSNGVLHVKLSRPDLPSVPLIMKEGKGGEVKLVGYPNVVMALDPNAVSPLAWAFGEDVVDLTNPQTMKNLLMLLGGYNSKHPIASGEFFQKEQKSTLGPIVRMAGGEGAADAIFTGETPKAEIEVRVYEKTADGWDRTKWTYQKITFEDLTQQMTNYAAFLEKQNENPSSTEASFPGSQEWQNAKDEYKAAFNEAVYGDAAGASGATIFNLLDLVGIFRVEDSSVLNSARILDLLGDKKANFSNASTPGYYRYWSSSSPNADDQAPSETYVAKNTPYGLERNMSDELKVMATYSSGMFKGGTNLTPPSTILSSPAVLGRYVEWDTTNAANVRQFRIAGSGGRVRDVHTDEIHTLKFTTGTVELSAMVALTDNSAAKKYGNKFNSPSLKKAYKNVIKTYLNNTLGEMALDDTLGDKFGGVLAQFWNLSFPGGGGRGNEAFFKLTVPNATSPQPVTNFINGGSSYTDAKPISKIYSAFQWENLWGGNPDYRLELADRDDKFESNKGHFPKGGKKGESKRFDLSSCTIIDVRRRLNCTDDCRCYSWGPDDKKRKKPLIVKKSQTKNPLKAKHLSKSVLSKALYAHVADKLSARVCALLEASYDGWYAHYKGKFDEDAAKKGFLEFQAFAKEFNTMIGYSGEKTNLSIVANWDKRYKAKGKFKKVTSVYSPIFPVSDAGGYRHFGSYAYGRGVSLNTQGGGFEKLLSEDPLDELDHDVVDAFVQGILRQGSQNLAEKIYEEGVAGESLLVNELLKMQTENPTAFNRATRRLTIKDPATGESGTLMTVRDYIDKYPKKTSAEGETQKLLAIGLINHFQRDDTPGLYTTPLNASHNLVDIMPSNSKRPSAGDEILWDSLVRMNAGDSNSFMYVAPTGADGTLQSNVVKQVQNDMVVNSATHSQYQGELRGKREKPREAVDFTNMFDDWNNFGVGDGTAAWENSAAGRAIEKLSQLGEANPDDPEIAAIMSRYSDALNNLEELDVGSLYGNSEEYQEREAAKKAAEAEREETPDVPPTSGGNNEPTIGGEGGDSEFDPEPEDTPSPGTSQDDPSATSDGLPEGG